MSDDQSQAQTDAHVAWTYAVSSVDREEQAPPAERTRADIVEGYAMEFLDYLDGSVPRALSAARAACISAAGEVAHPGRWRTAMRAVELCRRAAGIAAPDDDSGPTATAPDSNPRPAG
jgi:hypothetical protein